MPRSRDTELGLSLKLNSSPLLPSTEEETKWRHKMFTLRIVNETWVLYRNPLMSLELSESCSLSKFFCLEGGQSCPNGKVAVTSQFEVAAL